MITKNDLLNCLKEVDKKLNHKIVIVAVGGTAMTLLGLKASTRDVDFCVKSEDFKMFKELTKNDKFKFDLFQDGYIFSEQLPDDYIENSNRIKTKFSNLDLCTLSLIDIIITKAARYNARDEDDIESIAKTNLVKRNELKKK
ncbi:MAG: DUF6036 family nucleotidyltransferase [Candidatus Woesearchaeota archaeon]